jgi:MoxR-like ATPase
MNPCQTETGEIPDTCTWSEAFRARCEARHVMRMPTKDERNKYLARVEKARGIESAQRLKADVTRIWKATI